MAIVINGQTGIDAGHLPISNAGNTEVEGTFTGVNATVNSVTAGSIFTQGQNVSPFSGFKNYIINGNFDVWQRGASQTSSGYGSDDRWVNINTGSTKNHSQVACTDTERALFNASYFSRTVVTSVAGAGNECDKWQNIEDVSRLAGKTVTLSFWAKADSAKNIGIWFDQVFGSGGSAAVTLISNQLVALTTTWQKKTITVTLPSIVGKTVGLSSFTRVVFGFDNAAALVGRQSGTFDIAQVQLEEGSVATPFEQRPYGLELSLCQRYYEQERNDYIHSAAFSSSDSVLSSTTTMFKVEKRITPTVIVYDLGGNAGRVHRQTTISSGGADVAASVTATTKGFCTVLSDASNVAGKHIFKFTASAEL